MEGKSFRLADEVRYIQRRAADYDSRIVTIGQLILFSTKTGDAWLLGPADQLAARLARAVRANPSTSRKPIPRSRSVGRAAIASTGRPSVYSDPDTGRVATILGYPTDKLSQIG